MARRTFERFTKGHFHYWIPLIPSWCLQDYGNTLACQGSCGRISVYKATQGSVTTGSHAVNEPPAPRTKTSEIYLNNNHEFAKTKSEAIHEATITVPANVTKEKLKDLMGIGVKVKPAK